MIRLLSALLLLGCDAGPPPPPPAAATLTLGQITDADAGTFMPYSNGQDVTLVAGAQGGFHVWLSYQMTPAPTGDANLLRTAHRASDDALVLRTLGQVALSDQPSEPLPMFMCPAPVGISVLDTPIIYQLDFTNDDTSEIAHGSITLVPHCPADQLDFCQRICSG